VFDICVIGHITKDIVIIGKNKKELPGGVAYYFSLALKNLDPHIKIAVVTKLKKEDKVLLDELIKKDIQIFWKKSENTTIFENIYPESLDYRIQKVRSLASSFTVEDVKDISAKVFHLGPLTKRDIPLEVIKYLSRKAILSLDIQGFVRDIRENKVEESSWEKREEGLPYIDILKANEKEAEILTGITDINKAAKKLANFGIKEVVITMGKRGSLIFSEGKFYDIPAYPPEKEVDVTGCGDTYIAAYIYKRLKSFDIEFAGKFAAATATLKIEKFGAFKENKEKVYKLLKTYGSLK
jgi:sugar/nucleoside kinase (ribokinase family)